MREPTGFQQLLRTTWRVFIGISFGFGSLTPLPLRASDCEPTAVPLLWLTVAPDLGGIEPDTLVRMGTVVRLTGTSKTLDIAADCAITSSPLVFGWSATFQERGAANPVPVTLTGAGTTTPKFKATEVGVYTVTFANAFASHAIRVESVAVPDPWAAIGPAGLRPAANATADVGRINVLAADARKPTTLYAGSAQGGVFRSLDLGQSWHPISEHAGVPALEVGALASTGDGTLYAGFGERGKDRGGFEEPNAGLWRLDPETHVWSAVRTDSLTCPSTTSTATWRSDLPGRPERILAIWPRPGTTSLQRLLAKLFGWTIDAELIVASSQGLYRSPDSGKCWHALAPEGERFTDVVFVPSEDGVVVAASATRGLLRIGNIRGTPTVEATQRPFPTGVVFARLAQGFLRMHAIASLDGQVNATSARSLWSSDGLSWSAYETQSCGRQCDWYPAVAIDPKNEQHVWYGEVGLHRSTNRGQSFGAVQRGLAHVDFHDFLFAPSEPDLLFAASDGGVYSARLSADSARLVGQWEPRNRHLTSNQSATISISSAKPLESLMGSWDNGDPYRHWGRYWTVPHDGDGEGSSIDADGSTFYVHTNAGFGGDITRIQPGQEASVGAAPGFHANPYVAGELWAIRLETADDGGYYIARGVNGALPAQWHCADPEPGSPSPSASLAFSRDGYVFATRLDGSITRFRVPDVSIGTATCRNGVTAAMDVEVIRARALTDRDAGGTVAVDPASSDHIVAGVPGALDLGRRVIEATRTAGNPPTWAVTAAGNGLAPAGAAVLVGAVAGDGANLDTVYAGSSRGLWRGSRSESGPHTWSLVEAFPDAWVSRLDAWNASPTSQTVIRASTYGRGAWELHHLEAGLAPIRFSVPPNEPRWVLPPPCLACMAEYALVPRQRASGTWGAFSIDLPHAWRAPDTSVRATMLRSGNAVLGIVTAPVSVDLENGTAVVSFHLAGVKGDQAVFVDVAALDLVTPSGEVRDTVRDIPIARTLFRGGTAIVRVRSIEQQLGAIDIEQAITPIDNSNAVREVASRVFATREGNAIGFRAPMHSRSGATMVGWQVRGSASEWIEGPVARFEARGATDLTAVYASDYVETDREDTN